MMENQELAIEDLTASLLAKHRPDLVKKMYTEESLESNAPELLASMREGAKGEGFKAGVDAERQRCRAIVQEALALSATVKNGTEILKMSEKLLADGVEAKLVKTGEATTGSGEAIADLKLKAAQLLSTQGPPSPGANDSPEQKGAAGGEPKKWEDKNVPHVDRADAYRAAHPGTSVADALRATYIKG